jgi:hypothetical protein
MGNLVTGSHLPLSLGACLADVSPLALLFHLLLHHLFLCSHSPGAAYPDVPLPFPASCPLPWWSQYIFSFSTKTIFILEEVFWIRQVSKYLNVWGRDTLHAFHLDRCLNYSRNKYRWWIEKREGETEEEANFRCLACPSINACYCCWLKVVLLPVL